MGKICWDFPLLGTGNESGSNIAAITMFKGAGIMDGMAREVIQNSLDAVSDKSKPVHLDFTESQIKRDDFPEVFKGLQDAVDNGIAYWENNPNKTQEVLDFIKGVKEHLLEEYIPVLVCSDYNTTGLNGVNAKESEQSIWRLLVDTEGISIKRDENSAGSYGIGKNAPFAYSSMNLVFYNTVAEDQGCAFEGVARLVTTRRIYNNSLKKTQPIGKYLYLEDEFTGRPIKPDDNCPIARLPIFERNKSKTTGTDVAIVGFKHDTYEHWERLTAISVINNFILAIRNDKLTVSIKKDNEVIYDISKDSLKTLLFNEFKDEEQLKFSRQIFETIESPDNTSALSATICEPNDLSIYVKYNEKYEKSLFRFRSTGMLINRTQQSLPGYSVVIVVNETDSSTLSKTLRKCEPPQHNDWKSTTITDNPDLKRKAASLLKKITSAVQRSLDELDSSSITSSVDAGIGSYLPSSQQSNDNEGTSDGLKKDLKINSVITNEGFVIVNTQYESGSNNLGTLDNNKAVKTGKKKHRKKKRTKIKTVTPTENGTTKGVSKGHGKLKVTSLVFDESRTSKIGATEKYLLYVNSKKAFDNVYIRYIAGRDDSGEDPLIIKNYKADGQSLKTVNSSSIGPISLVEGDNRIFIEFQEEGKLMVNPTFTREVYDNDEQNT